MTDLAQTQYELALLISNTEERIAEDQAKVRILRAALSLILQGDKS